jgi:hypothetical protein
MTTIKEKILQLEMDKQYLLIDADGNALEFDRDRWSVIRINGLGYSRLHSSTRGESRTIGNYGIGFDVQDDETGDRMTCALDFADIHDKTPDPETTLEELILEHFESVYTLPEW